MHRSPIFCFETVGHFASEILARFFGGGDGGGGGRGPFQYPPSIFSKWAGDNKEREREGKKEREREGERDREKERERERK